jgi:hypothetical protein
MACRNLAQLLRAYANRKTALHLSLRPVVVTGVAAQ